MITVLNTGLANAASVLYAIERLGYSATLTDDPDQIQQSSRVILPGVGTASALMKHLQSHELNECLNSLTQPVLGICLGMQAFYEFSEEGGVNCLGIFPGQVKKITPVPNTTLPQPLPIPHMGWNQVIPTKNSLLLKGIPNESHFYFVHSFRVPLGSETVAFTEYGEEIPAVIESSHWFGTQFHPERSGKIGEKVLRNFLTL